MVLLVVGFRIAFRLSFLLSQRSMASAYTYGLIGRWLSHSFSPRFFAKKFAEQPEEQLTYGLFEIESIAELPKLMADQPTLRGLNVTFPYKKEVCAYVDELHPLARRTASANALHRLPDGRWRGYNTDYTGFVDTLALLPDGDWRQRPALICGQGGAGRAVGAALQDIGLRPQWVSRRPGADLTYQDLQSAPELLQTFGLIVQATPLGTYPSDEAPSLPYSALLSRQLLYDLAYNPPETPFLRAGRERKCHTINGEAMLYAQAEESWRIWQT